MFNDLDHKKITDELTRRAASEDRLILMVHELRAIVGEEATDQLPLEEGDEFGEWVVDESLPLLATGFTRRGSVPRSDDYAVLDLLRDRGVSP